MPFRRQAQKAALIVGAAFLSLTPSVHAHPVLTRQLLAEGDWKHARREALRDLSEAPLDASAAFTVAICDGIESGKFAAALSELNLLSTSTNAWIAAAAHLALGHLDVSTGSGESARGHFAAAFLHSPDPALAENAAGMLTRLASDGVGLSPSLLGQAQAMVSDGAASPPLWVTAWIVASREPEPSSSGAASVLTGFYRTQISPAIGARCPMHPSCSTYFRQAADKHGFWIAVPMIGDRFVREPHHYKHRIRPVNVRGMEKSFDPPEYHDYWFNDHGRPPTWNE